jgi:uncharacterized protein with von Willebrand factor type A (vWA) domain
MLGAALLVPYVLAVVSGSLADLPIAHRAVSVLCRTAFIALLAVGLSQPVRTETTHRVCGAFLVDVSDSMSDAALEDSRHAIERAIALKAVDDDVRLATFARRPRVVPLAPSAGRVSIPPIERLGGTLGAGTDIAGALQLAYGLCPAGTIRRVVILSDGVETEGDVLAEARRASRYGVKVFAIPSRRPVPGEVALRELRAPDHVREGETFDLHADVFSSVSQTVSLSLQQGEVDNALDARRVVDLEPGDNDVVFKSRAVLPGDLTYTLRATDAREDHFAENNRTSTVVSVLGRPVVLYVEGEPSATTYLAGALSAQDLSVDTVDPLPTTAREAERYDFIILSDVPASRVSLVAQDTIEQYVRDLGGGFLFAGGENGYGLGGWDHTTIERILPVRADAEKRRDEPEVAMTLVIDRSGSMTGLPLEMAKQAARATAETLAPDDLIEVIAFDSQPVRIVHMLPAKHRVRIQDELAHIQAGGGTEIFSALDAAYQVLSTTRAKKKHVILLTDGQAPRASIRELVQTMSAESITVSTVGLGGGVDESLLRMISDVGGGRYYKVSDPQSLPRIFTRETEMVSRSADVEQYFQPRVVAPAGFLRGVDMDSAPFLRGYVATRLKPAPAQEILESELGEPILARWHVGLGYSLAWTSDVKNRWAVDWVRWHAWGQFWGQLVREHMRQKNRQVIDMRAGIDPVTGHVHAIVDAIGTDDRFQNGLQAHLSVMQADATAHGASRDDVRRETMWQTAPGRYEADFPMDRYGSYSLKAALESDVSAAKGGLQRVTVAESFGHVSNSYPREYRALSPDVVTLERAAEITSGTTDPSPATLFDPAGDFVTRDVSLWPRFVGAALALFLLDVFVRRVRFSGRPLLPTRAAPAASAHP